MTMEQFRAKYRSISLNRNKARVVGNRRNSVTVQVGHQKCSYYVETYYDRMKLLNMFN